MGDSKKRGAVLPPYTPNDVQNNGSGESGRVPEGIIKVKGRLQHSDARFEIYPAFGPEKKAGRSPQKEGSRSKTESGVKVMEKKNGK